MHAADFLTNPFFVKSSMTSKGFFGCQKTGGKGWMGSDLTISYVSSGLGLAPFTGAKGGIFWGEGSEVFFQGIYSFPTGARGGRCACDILWFVVQRYDNSWTTENSGPCFQPKRQKRPQNSRNHHLGWVLIRFNMGQWTRQKMNWLARFCQQFPWFLVKEFCWEWWFLVGWSSPECWLLITGIYYF